VFQRDEVRSTFFRKSRNSALLARDIIVSGNWDDTVRAWDADTGQPIGDPTHQSTGHTTS
jgi:hypothetical protein